MCRSLLGILVAVLFAPCGAEVPDVIHLIQPYPRGKADSVLAAKDRLVFIPTSELKALEEAVKAGRPTPPAPPVPATIAAASLEGAPEGDMVRIVATYTVDVLEKGPVYVPLVARDVPVLSVRHAGAALTVSPGGPTPGTLGPQERASEWWGIVTEGTGRMVVTATFGVPVTKADDGGSFQLTLPAFGAASLTLTLPTGDWDVECTGASLRRTKPSVVELIPDGGRPLTVAWRQAARRALRPREVREASLDASAEHLVSIGEAAVRGQVQLGLKVWTGQVQVLDITRPEGIDVMNVSGPNIDTWEQTTEALRVFLASPVQGEERILVEYLLPMSGPEGAVPLPSFSVNGARRQLAHWAVVATTNVEIELAETHGVETLQPRELPEGLKGTASGRILAALRGDPSQASVVVQVSRHTDVPVLVASIDHARLSTVVYESGYEVTTCRYAVRNTTKQFLELSLPPRATLWDVRVDRQPVRPGLVGGVVLVPLASSLGRSEETSFPVELTYLVPVRLGLLGGSLVITGPRPDLPSSRVEWEVRFPERVRALAWSGNMERVRPPRRFVLPKRVMEDPRAIPPDLVEQRAMEKDLQAPPAVQAPEEEPQRVRELTRQYLERQAAGKVRRSVGRPSVEVTTPAVGQSARFTQILQQAQAPRVRCLYVRGRVWWVLGVAVAGALVAVVVANRRRHAVAVLLLLVATSQADTPPREVLRMVPHEEVARLLTGPSAQELAYLPYEKVRSLLQALGTIPSTPSRSISFLDKVEVSLVVEDDEARVRGNATVTSLGPGWRSIDLVTGARVLKVTLAGTPATLWTSEGTTRLLTEGEGTRPLAFEYELPVVAQGNARSLVCPLPQSAGCVLSLALPLGSSGLAVDGRRIELENGPTHATAVIPVPGRTSVALSWRYVPPELALPSPQRGEALPTRGRLLAESVSLFSVDAGTIEGRTKVTVDIIQGGRDSLVFAVPSGVDVLDVTSPSATDWTVIRDGPGQLVVLLRSGTKGRVVLHLTHAVGLEDSLATVWLREPAIQGAVRYRGQAGVQVLTSVRVTPLSQSGSTRTDPREVPQDLWAMASNPILLAYKHIDPGYAIEVRVERQRDIPLLTASIDRERLVSVISSSGRIVTSMRLWMRNSGDQFLKVFLPEGATVWSYQVNGTTSAPSRGDDGGLRLPIPPSPERDRTLLPVKVELVWSEEIDLRPFGNRLTLRGPRMELPRSVVEWEVYVPAERRWIVASTNLDRHRWPHPWVMPEGAGAEVMARTQLNIAEESVPTPGEGLAVGAMPVRVDIPEEGESLEFSRAMVIGWAPEVNLVAVPLVPRGVGVSLGAVLLALLWRFSTKARWRGVVVRLLLTVVAVVLNPWLGLAAVAGIVWRVAVRLRTAARRDATGS